MERKIKKEVIDPSYMDYHSTPKLAGSRSEKSLLSLSQIKQEIQFDRSQNNAHDISDSDKSEDEDLSIPDQNSDHEFSDSDETDDGAPARKILKQLKPTSSKSGKSSPSVSNVLYSLVNDPSDFDEVQSPGSLTVTDLYNPNNEYYIIRFPTGMINPRNLANTECLIGSKKPHQIDVKGKTFEVSSYENYSTVDTPTLFLPDAAGRLKQVNIDIHGHVLIKQPPPTHAVNPKIDLDDLRARVHTPPEIKARNFFGVSGGNLNTTMQPKSKRDKSFSAKKRSLKGEVRSSPASGKKKSIKSLPSTPFDPSKKIKVEKDI